MLLLCVFAVPAQEQAGFGARARRAVQLLSEQPGCLAAVAGPAVDDPERWVLSARFASVTAYRRALSPFAVRSEVAPLLAECLPGVPSTYEVLLDAVDGVVEQRSSLRAGDAEVVDRAAGAADADR